MRVALESLRLGPVVAAGSQGSIHHVLDQGTAGFAMPLIYKEFAAGTAVSATVLEVLASYRQGLAEGQRRFLDEHAVWPLAVVSHGDRISGYLMACIPDRFMQSINRSDGSQELIPREVQHLFVAEGLARRNIGEAPTVVERLALARDLAYVFGFFGHEGFVYGDLSYKNAVYALRPAPSILLLDCDSIRRRGQGAAVTQLNSPGWAAPEHGPQTVESDRYKLGLFVLRCLTPGVNAQNRDPERAAGALDGTGMALLRRSVGDDPAARPSGREWVEHLDRAVAAHGGVAMRTAPAARPAPPPRVQRPVVSQPVASGAAHRPASRSTGAVHGPAVPPALRRPVTTSPGPPNPWGWWRPAGTPVGVQRAPTPKLRPSTATVIRSVFAVAWIVVVGLVVYAVSTGWTSPSSGTGTTPPSTFAAPVAPVAVAVPFSTTTNSAVAAVNSAMSSAASTRVVGLMSGRPVTIPGPFRLEYPPPVWTVSVAPKAGTAGAVHVVVTDGSTDSDETNQLVVGRSTDTTLPDHWPTFLSNALGSVSTRHPGEQATYRWLCPNPADPGLTACVWEFWVVSPAPGAAGATVWVRVDGEEILRDDAP
jgi:hypothetical protein